METFDPFRPSDPVDSPAHGIVRANGSQPNNQDEPDHNHDGNTIVNTSCHTTTNNNNINDDETGNCKGNDEEHGDYNSNSNSNSNSNGNGIGNGPSNPGTSTSTSSAPCTGNDNNNDDEDEEDDIAFAAEAAANAVEEADAEQQRLDQALLRCRICGQGAMEGRPILRFLPMNPALANLTTQALPPGSPALATFPEDICLHIFCGKTASILPSVNQPDMEILTKAGIKNKHGIGAEVNAALARTRCANIVTATLTLGTLGVLTDAEETPSSAHANVNATSNTSASTNANATNKQEKQYFLVREFEAHLAAIRSSHQPLPLPAPSPVTFLGDTTHASKQRILSMLPSSSVHARARSTLSNRTDGTTNQRIPSALANDHSTPTLINNTTSSGNNMHGRSNYFIGQGLIPMSTNNVSLGYTAMDGPTTSCTQHHSPDAPHILKNPSPGTQTSTGAPSTANRIGSPAMVHNNYSHIVMTSTRNPHVDMLPHNSMSSVYSQSLSESHSQSPLCAGSVSESTKPSLSPSEHIPLPQAVADALSNESSLTPPVPMNMGVNMDMDMIVQVDLASQSISTDDGIVVATQDQNLAASPTPIGPTRAAAGKASVKQKIPKQSIHSLGEFYSSPPPENQPFTSDGRVKCGCGGTYMYTGTPKGAASWRSHVVTKRHQKWLRTHSQNTVAGNNVYV